MRNGREFVLADVDAAGPEPLKALQDTAGDGLAWTGSRRSRTCRRTWLDTFDWRLLRAGLVLAQVSTGSATDLVLTRADGSFVAAQPLPAGSVPRWPCLAAALPPGPVRDAVAPAAGIRALAPAARAVSRIADLQALNGDAKTVARVAVDRMTVTYPARAAAPTRLSLVPVRGYQAQAARAARAISALPGACADGTSALESALAAAGRRPGELPGKAAAIPLDPAMLAGQGVTAILTALLDVLEANVPGTIADVDTEFLHDLRIAVRWTRSAVKLCGDALPAGLAQRFGPEFRWLGELTATPRDLDVYLLGYDAMAAGLTGAAPGDLAPFRDQLAAARAAAYRQLASGLRSARFRRLRADWRAALAGADTRGASSGRRREPTVAELADARVAAAHRKVLAAGRKITPASPPERLHNLRKRCKELRYLVEMFGSLPHSSGRWPAVRELKALQDCLGEFQDAEVQHEQIREFAGQMLAGQSAQVDTLLAMGEVAAGLAQRKRRARAQFDARFAAFARPSAGLAPLDRTAAA